MRGADAHPGGRHPRARLHRPRDSEVGQLRRPVLPEQDVLRLDVPVYQALLVGVVQRPRHRHSHRSCLGRRHPLRMGADAGLQVSAGHQRHGIEVMALSMPELEHGDDVGMAEPGGRPHLAFEALDPLGVARELGRHCLQRHFPAQALVLGTVDVRHAPAAQQREDAVMAQPGADLQGHR